jgi:hypothetical protein
LAWGGGGGLDSTGSGQGPVVGCCECGDEPSGSCAMELVSYGDHMQVDEMGRAGQHEWKMNNVMWESERRYCSM